MYAGVLLLALLAVAQGTVCGVDHDMWLLIECDVLNTDRVPYLDRFKCITNNEFHSTI